MPPTTGCGLHFDVLRDGRSTHLRLFQAAQAGALGIGPAVSRAPPQLDCCTLGFSGPHTTVRRGRRPRLIRHGSAYAKTRPAALRSARHSGQAVSPSWSLRTRFSSHRHPLHPPQTKWPRSGHRSRVSPRLAAASNEPLRRCTCSRSHFRRMSVYITPLITNRIAPFGRNSLETAGVFANRQGRLVAEGLAVGYEMTRRVVLPEACWVKHAVEGAARVLQPARQIDVPTGGVTRTPQFTRTTALPVP